MTKVTLDINAFKALASDTRLDLLKTLDGKRMSLKEISVATKLNKATLHEHLTKLNEAGLVKKNERTGHKWVYYTLSWKGECLLHPENSKIVVLFSATFVAFWIGVIQLLNYAKGRVVNFTYPVLSNEDSSIWKGNVSGFNNTTMPQYAEELETIPENSRVLIDSFNGNLGYVYQDPIALYISIVCFMIFTFVFIFSIWRLWENRSQKI